MRIIEVCLFITVGVVNFMTCPVIWQLAETRVTEFSVHVPVVKMLIWVGKVMEMVPEASISLGTRIVKV